MTPGRVFVSGMGIVSPCGNGVDEGFDRVCAGEARLKLVPADLDRNDPAAAVAASEFDPRREFSGPKARIVARAAHMAVHAGVDAVVDAGLEHDDGALSKAAIYLGCALGGSEVMESQFGRWTRMAPVRPATVPMIMPSGPAGHLSIRLGIRGPSHTYSIACVSSAVAIGEAFRALRGGYADRALAGGAEAQLNRGTVAGWQALGAVAHPDPDRIDGASRPFDAGRTGFVLGEGAAVLVLETEAALAARGGTALAEIVGYGAASDAQDLTEPSAEGQAAAMRAALAEAGIDPDRIGYLNAHATGTRNGDPVECEAIRRVFAGDGPAVSSTKGVHGHLIGAAGALEAVWTICALGSGRIPPTANLDDPAPECALPGHVREELHMEELEWAMSNSFAFGGSNASLVFRRV